MFLAILWGLFLRRFCSLNTFVKEVTLKTRSLLQPCMFTLWLYFRFQLSYEQVWKTSNPAAKEKTAKTANSCLTNYNLLRNFCVFLKINRLIASVQFAKFSTDQLSLSIFLFFSIIAEIHAVVCLRGKG